MFVTDLLILWHVCKCAICLNYFALRRVTCFRRTKSIVGNSSENVYLLRYVNRIWKSLQPWRKWIPLLLLPKLLLFLCRKNRKMTSTMCKGTRKKKSLNITLKTSMRLKVFFWGGGDGGVTNRSCFEFCWTKTTASCFLSLCCYVLTLCVRIIWKSTNAASE